ncbi:MAG: archaellin/type IV pilin N-terminal domain-containing protein [Candidatus Aenigmatarchaeota archaeon]|nr:hypothetical protein [Nanoarchaeota archaeon]
MSKSRKGVSPIIAVVILIAVAVSIGIMVTTWVTHWVTTQTGSDDITCSIDTTYVIESAKFNVSAYNVLLLKITNKNEKGLYGFGVVMDNGTRVVQFNSSDSQITTDPVVSAADMLTQEEAIYISVNLSNSTLAHPWLGATLTEVRVTNDACPTVTAKTNAITQP